MGITWRGREKATIILGLSLVLALGAYLRMCGLRWGVNGEYSHHRSFQPDEFISLRGLLPLDIRDGKLKAPGAYFEGTFNYYLWELPIACKELVSRESHRPLTYSHEATTFALLAGRTTTVVLDLLTTVIIYAIIQAAGGSYGASIFGAFIYSIVPMQVIYAHFMRPHVLSNFFCAFVLWQSLAAIKTPSWARYGLIGILSGLAAATRYPVGIILSIPILLVLFRHPTKDQKWSDHMVSGLRFLVAGPLWWLGAGTIVGLFLGHPYLFIDPASVYHAISNETFRYVPSDARNFSQVLPLWNYISTLTRYAMFPLLWIMAYASAAYLLFRRQWRPVIIPLLIFSLLYAYPMSKAYLAPFSRQVMLLIPGFCAIAALAIDDLWKLRPRSAALRSVVVVLLIVFAVPSLVFDLAYTHAMQGEDARTTLHRDLETAIGDRIATINVSPISGYFYTAMPAADALSSKNISVTLNDETSPADYLLLGFERPLTATQRALQIRTVESKGNYKYVREYYSPPFVCGKAIDLSHFPPDMTYPFPTILLFRTVAKS